MHSRRDAVALALLLGSLLLVAIFARPRAAEMDEEDPRASTYRSSPQGARALFLLLDQLDIPAARMLAPWLAGDLGEPVGALVVLAPVERPTPREIADLLQWVRDGGTLIYAGTSIGQLNRDLGLHHMRLRPDTISNFAAARWQGAVARPAPHALTAGIDSVPGFRIALHPRGLPAGTEVLLSSTGDAPVVVTFPLGSGRVMAWSDAAPLTNRFLREGGAALLFARAAEQWRADAAIAFDEYHHGYRGGGPGAALSRFVRETGAGRALLQVAFALLLVLLLYGRRFGAPLPDAPPARRSPLEHVEAVAGAYRSAGARETARRLLFAGAERRLGRRLAGSAKVLDASPAGRRLREEWERWERGGATELAALAGAVDDYLVEVRRWKQAE